jgi:hypothetical protein
LGQPVRPKPTSTEKVGGWTAEKGFVPAWDDLLTRPEAWKGVTDGPGRKLKLAGNLGEVTDQEKRATEREVQELTKTIERLKAVM